MKNLIRAVFFGVLSILFGFVQFNLPIYEDANSSLSEIPMLVSVLYITNPWYLLIVAGISAVEKWTLFSLFSFFMHSTALILFYFFHKRIITKYKDDLQLTGYSSAGVVGYYIILVVPLLFVIQLNASENLWNVFTSLIKSISFEVTATIMVVTLYILQNKATIKLKEHLHSLEDTVRKRTIELDKAIHKLNEANDELKLNNESLDKIVANRTLELKNRNIQLTGYAFVNSHLLRAPLARILGLANLLKHELNTIDDDELINKFLQACNELDEVVNLLSEFLSEESVLSEEQLDDLQERIMQIASEIKR